MLRALRSTTSRLLRCAALLATVAQATIAAAPVADRDASRSSPAHIEAGGISVHFAHDEASCPACAAQQLLASGERRTSTIPAGAARLTAPAAAPTRLIALLDTSANPPRAPPVVS